MSGGGGGGGGGGGEEYEGEGSKGGNRWPKQETDALLQIRFDMDAVFRDSSLKAPLWEQVSRKMGELGYHRSSKKCREKFENVYKYHKRTKDGRVGKSEGKHYRFYDQLEALDQQLASSSSLPPLPPRSQPEAAVPVTMLMPAGTIPCSVTVTSNPPQVHSYQINNVTPIVHPQVQPTQQQQQPQPYHSNPIEVEDVSSPSGTMSLSSSTFSDEEVLRGSDRKRKWKGFFERMVKRLIDKQVELQNQFLEEIEKRERESLAREEAWKAIEMGRLNREHELLTRERSMSAAKDAALVEMLKKVTNQEGIIPLSIPTLPPPQNQNSGEIREPRPTNTQSPPPPPQSQPILQKQPQSQEFETQVVQVAKVQVPENTISFATPQVPVSVPMPTSTPQAHVAQQRAFVVANTNNANVDIHKTNNGGEKSQHQASSSRWPKAEVEALINLRTQMDQKYQENVPKGPLWEEMSSLMKNLGYNRNAKRCKEKWENINKYFKKVKESNKKRPEDSKTCPYFHQLDALYQQKAVINPANAAIYTRVKPENLNTMGPIMARPEQQWPSSDHGIDDVGSGNDSEDDGDEGDDDDQGSGGFEFVANNNSGNNGGGNSGVNLMTTSTIASLD